MKNWRLCSDNWRKLSFKIEKKLIIAFVGLDGDENSNSKSVLKDGLNECSSNRRKVFKKTFQYYLPRMASGFRDVQFLSNHIFDRKSLQGKFYMYFYILNCQVSNLKFRRAVESARRSSILEIFDGKVLKN